MNKIACYSEINISNFCENISLIYLYYFKAHTYWINTIYNNAVNSNELFNVLKDNQSVNNKNKKIFILRS